jgi:hypothetical protein
MPTKFDDNTVLHPAGEFGGFPYGKVKFRDGHLSNLSLGSGGYGLRDDEMSLCLSEEDLSAEVWVLPEVIALLITNHAEIEVEENKRKIRRLLGAAAD